MNIHVVKTVPIEFKQVVDAYCKVKQGGKASGVDKETWTDFDKSPEKNLYVIWNRLASGSYHPQAVREVEIPKKDGTKRKLGIPTLRDRIAQQVVKDYMEKKIDCLFHENSYGYRPLKSAHQAVEQVRQNSYLKSWVIDMDISKFFDEIDHDLMLKAVEHAIEDKWVKMYVERWLKMPLQSKDGKLNERTKGTPQGGVISPLLANLYLHYTLDIWLRKYYPNASFVRYADDVVIHCNTKAEAERVLTAVKNRLSEVKLSIKEEKTRIAYCKDYARHGDHKVVQFDFLGFSYRPRPRKSKRNEQKTYMAFTAEISLSNQKKIRDAIRNEPIWRNTTLTPEDIAKFFESKLRGWIGYYGKYSRDELRRVLQKVDFRLVKWIKRKHKIGIRKAEAKFKRMKQENPFLFYHWQMKYS